MTRPDNRAANALRPISFSPNFTMHAEGSVLVATGNTRVLCTASIEESVPRWKEASGGGWLTAEYGMLPRSTNTRIDRKRAMNSGRTKEIQRLIGRSLRAAFDLDALGARTVTVDCDVLQADGGTRTASITGGYVAVAMALQKLVDAGVVPPDVFRVPVAAVSVGVVNGEPMLDLCYVEDSAAEVDMNVVMTGDGQFIEVQGTAEGAPYSRQTLNVLLDLAEAGIMELLTAQSVALGR